MVNNSTNIKKKKTTHFSLQTIEYSTDHCIYIYLYCDGNAVSDGMGQAQKCGCVKLSDLIFDCHHIYFNGQKHGPRWINNERSCLFLDLMKNILSYILILCDNIFESFPK